MKTNRPVNLDLTTVKFPITAIVSITHRVTGMVLLAGMLILMYMLDMSLDSEEGFQALTQTLQNPIAKVVLWAVLAALAYHSVAGVRHLIMDFGVGETLEGGKRGAAIVVGLSVILMILAGVWIW